MNQLLRLLMRTGLSLLEPERVDSIRDKVSDRIDDIGEKTRKTYDAASKHASRVVRSVRGEREDHTLGNTLAFLAGIGTGVAVGILFAPASGEQTRSSLAETAQEVTGKVRDRFSSASGTTGTYSS